MVFGQLRSKITVERVAAAAAVGDAVVDADPAVTPFQQIELLPIPAAVVALDDDRLV